MSDAAPSSIQRAAPAPWSVRLFLLGEGVSFVLAALVHFGVLLSGYEHPQARIAESVIAAVLLAGCGLAWLWPAQTRSVGLAVQSFALLGTLVGVLTIAGGVGPRSLLDVAYHLGMLVGLACGLALTMRMRA
jgi:hypothetical protein